MKILYHHRTLSRDGQSVHIDELVRALRDLGHDVLVVGPTQHANASFGSDAGVIAHLKQAIPGSLYEVLEVAYNIPAFWRLAKAYRAFKPDVLYERYSLFLLAGLWLHHLRKLPMLLEVNAPLADERRRFDHLRLKTLADLAEKWVWCGADRALPVTGVLAEHLRANGVPAERLTIVPNGIGPEFLASPPETTSARRRLGIEAQVVLGFVGFMRPWHGLNRVVDFIADAGPEAGLHLLLIGDGPARTDLENQARARGVSHQVTFTGVVPRDRIIEHIAAFDVALQPDVVSYASPLKLFEYMALGRAIIAPDTANIREVIKRGENALLFDPARDDTFRAALSQLCADAGLRHRLGAAARDTIVRDGFTWARNAARVERMARELLPAISHPLPQAAGTISTTDDTAVK
jgi:glycosyltransferase involved in cell wall biosynthesis